MEDRVLYAVPFGALGRLVHRWIVAPMLGRIFAFRLPRRSACASASPTRRRPAVIAPMRAAAPA
ncbi:MAG: hypothetical protein R3A79_13595 [Nannocystaceae bacterium]